MIRFSVPLRVKSLNAREHWRAKARRVAKERSDTHMAALHQLGAAWTLRVCLPCTVTMTRVGRKRFDSDNLVGSLKAVRDQIADDLKTGDGPDGPVTWRYAQRVGREYAVEIEIDDSAGRAAQEAFA